MKTNPSTFSFPLFSAFGIEAEYMIVDAATLQVRPWAEKILSHLDPSGLDEVSYEHTHLSNELTAHVIEIKCAEPYPPQDLEQGDLFFHRSILKVNSILEAEGAILMPTAMHPFMNPLTETVLWPHGAKDIYEAYHRLFNCQGHGWSNLQSVHINLPYASEKEFVNLYNALRFVLPLIPYWAASSPIVEGQFSTIPSARLKFYENNQAKIPSITGDVIPDVVNSLEDYLALCQGLYHDILPHDPERILAHPWLNSRGLIAKFDYGALEIRLMDIQESPYMDFCLIEFFVAVARALAEERWCPLTQLNQMSSNQLKQIYLEANSFESSKLLPLDFVKAFGIDHPCSWRELSEFLLAKLEVASKWQQGLKIIHQQGHLAARISRSCNQIGIEDTYRKLIRNLQQNSFFVS